MTDIEVTAIQQDNPRDYRLQCSAAFEKWRQKLGSNATYLSLTKGLEKVGHLDVVEAVCKAFQRDGCGASISDPDSIKCSGNDSEAEVTSLSDRVKGFEERFKSLVKDTLVELEKNSKITTKDLTFDLTLLPSDIKDNHAMYIKEMIKDQKT